MARVAARLPEGVRLSDRMSLGVVAGRFPLEQVHRILAQTGRASQRIRQIPAHWMVYYVIALGLYLQVPYGEVLRCLIEGLRALGWDLGRMRRTGSPAITAARNRLGVEPLRELYRHSVQPLAQPATVGAWYAGRRIVCLDGTTLDCADTPENEAGLGRPSASSGRSAYPQVRLVTLAEAGTHVMFALQLGRYEQSEHALARELLPALRPDMLCLADRLFYSFGHWEQAQAQGAALLWRVSKSIALPVHEELADGSYLSRLFPGSAGGCSRRTHPGVAVRVIEYTLAGAAQSQGRYRLITTLLDPGQAPAKELAALYAQRWQVETTFDELKTHLRGARVVLRSRTPELVHQEIYGLFLAHFVVRSLMHEAALGAGRSPQTLSFTHAVRVLRRRLPAAVALSPCGQESVARL
jgi:hypothetical protein